MGLASCHCAQSSPDSPLEQTGFEPSVPWRRRCPNLDEGPGIPDSERPQLFERFYRLATAADQGVPGTGLGLAIAKSVVEAHDGTVDVVDTPGWSTTFRVLLPLIRKSTSATPLSA